MITRIEATRYRCLEFLDTDLQLFAVLVGANGAGKTTFLDIPGLLGDCLQQREVGQAFTTRQHNRPPRGSTLNEFVFSLHFPRKYRICGDWARRRERRLFGADR